MCGGGVCVQDKQRGQWQDETKLDHQQSSTVLWNVKISNTSILNNPLEHLKKFIDLKPSDGKLVNNVERSDLNLVKPFAVLVIINLHAFTWEFFSGIPKRHSRSSLNHPSVRVALEFKAELYEQEERNFL